MKITYVYDSTHPELQDCPAGCIIESGVIVINPDLFFKYSDFHRKFILLHEEGHIRLKTGIQLQDEIKADAYAFDHLAGTEFKSLKQCMNLLEILLVPGLPSTDIRIAALYDRAIAWDNRH